MWDNARMARKHTNYIKEWRRRAELTQKKLASLLAEKVGDEQPEDPTLRVPTTEASLSRIENGKQNFSVAALEALADVFSDILDEKVEPGWLLSRNPFKAGEVVSFFDRLDEKQSERAVAVLEAMFGRAG